MRFRFLAALCFAAVTVTADDGGASTAAEDKPPDWTEDNVMHLTLSTKPSYQFTIIPQTDHVTGDRKSSSKDILLQAHMVTITNDNWSHISGPDRIAFLSCDAPSDKDSFGIQPSQILNQLMGANLAAIVLYSPTTNYCSFENKGSSNYGNVFSMAEEGESSQALKFLNGTSSGQEVEATITGSDGSKGKKSKGTSPGNSAVAMSVLYSITGLITLLFLIIIATGTIRAHRNPERYGPRSALGGRSRQSRAKGIARAVLDTIPIVKFGNQHPEKPDPEVELESASVAQATTNDERRASAATSVAHSSEAAGALDNTDKKNEKSVDADADAENATAIQKDTASAKSGGEGGTHLGCSICTEDFQVGEDVRVLPCGHQFHPTCVDPWLINVSGTCPLCRLDLQPQTSRSSDDRRGSRPASYTAANILPPPLRLEPDEIDGYDVPHRTRLSRLLDINYLRDATREEQIATLRQMRATRPVAETDARADDDTQDEGRRGARLAAKLKERFRIRTRAQSAAGPSDS